MKLRPQFHASLCGPEPRPLSKERHVMPKLHVSLIVALLLVAACKPQEPAAAAATGAPDVATRTVRVAPVETGTSMDEVEVVGELEGIEEIRIYAQVPERIRKLAVREGDRVKEGDLLATVDGDVQSQVVLQSQASLEAAVANRDGVLDNLQRTRTLVQGGSGTPSQLLALEAQARAAEAQVRQATAGMAQASAQKRRTVQRAPVDGVVSQLVVREGDIAGAGQAIMTVVNDSQVKVVLRVPERDFLRVAQGMPVRVAPLAAPDQIVEGTVTLKGPIVDRTTRTGLVEIILPNEGRKLVAGSAVRVRIEIARRENVVLVPTDAVLLSPETELNGKAATFVAKGEKAERRDIIVGRRQGARTEVLEGLTPGESLVVRGAHLLKDGNPIKLEAPAAPVKEATR
jgi:multidrug efflux system membrane fusion protein